MTGQLYVVQEGDSLSGIVGRFCGDPGAYGALAALNNIADPNQVYAGQTLTIDCAAIAQWDGTGAGTPPPTGSAQPIVYAPPPAPPANPNPANIPDSIPPLSSLTP